MELNVIEQVWIEIGLEDDLKTELNLGHWALLLFTTPCHQSSKCVTNFILSEDFRSKINFFFRNN